MLLTHALLGSFSLGRKKKGYCRETLADGKKESQDKSDIRDGDDDDVVVGVSRMLKGKTITKAKTLGKNEKKPRSII